MSNVQSYNALIDRFKAFASGHFILKTFSHGQIDTADLEKFTEYPFMHVVPSNVTYAKGTKTFSFQIVLADLPRDKDDKVEFQREVLSDLQRIAEDLVAEITNHRVLFGDLITVQNVTLEPFLEEFHNTLTGWTVSLELLVPYYWDACSIPAEWNDFFESGSGGTGSILTFIDSITRDNNGNVSLVNDEATPSPNYYYGTNNEGVRGWYLLSDEVGLTCETIGSCQTIIDIEAAIDALEEEIVLKADITSISAVGFSNDYNDLDNLPTIPTATSDLTNDGDDGVNPFITAQDLPSLTGYVPYTGATQDVDLGTHNLTADHIGLNVSPSGAGYVVGATQWTNTIGSSETLLKGGSVSLKNGVDLVARVVNKVTPNTTLTKAAYQAVRVSGAQGQRLAVAFAQANNDNNSADTIGLVTETIATNQEGFILTVGQLEGINTTGSLQGETWTDGDVLYLSPTTAGALTNIKPTGATGHIVVIGYVEYAHANNGKIYVKIMNGWELDELHNVYISSPANNNVLTYESSTSLWKNKTVETALGFTPVPTTRSLTINGTTQDLSANRTFSVGTFNLPALTSGSVLFSNGTTIAQDNANLFYDDTNNRLGIGTATPQDTLTVSGQLGNLTSELSVINTSGGKVTFRAGISGISNAGFTLLSANLDGTSETARLAISVSGNVLINTTTDAGYKLDVNGSVRTTGSISAASAIARGTFLNQTLVATANSDSLAGLEINPTFTNGAFTGVKNNWINLVGNASINFTNQLYLKRGDVDVLFASSVETQLKTVSSSSPLKFFLGSTSQYAQFFATTGNLTLQNGGTFTDAGYRLDVNGAIRVQNNFSISSGFSVVSLGNNVNLRSFLAGGSGYVVNAQSYNTLNSSNNEQGFAEFTGTYAPTSVSGTPSFNALKLTPTINQTGGANGITRGLYINPTLTAAADFRAIEVASGTTVLAPSVTARASLRIPSGTAPTSPVNGDIWFDGTDIKMRIGGVTKTFTLL